MEGEENNWIELPKFSERYISGIRAFVQNAFSRFAVGDEMTCPCKICNNRKWRCQNVIYDHLIYNGPSPLYAQWICEVSRPHLGTSDENMECEDGIDFGDNLGEMLHRMQDCEDKYSKKPNADNFYHYFEDGKQPLYSGCTTFSRLGFIIRLYSLKCIHGFTESAVGALLEFMREILPQAHIPLSFKAAKNVIRDLGLDYQKIHACPNNCMLYWAENEKEEVCRTCGVSRWALLEKKGTGDNDPKKLIHKVPAKVMRYFPLKPRLQRLFMCKEYSELMLWHSSGRKKDGKLRHPADAEAWKTLDAKYPHFSSENRNIRLGLASDGFSPYRTMSTTHSTWPIVLVNYNLPPWLCMKPENLILSTLISGPDSPKNSIDVFMQPLMAELRDLWDIGIDTYDAFANENFILRASVLWTISDFPGYAMLSGWSTKGKLACPVCHYETSSMYLKNSRKMCYMNHRKFLDPDHKWRFDKRRFNGEIEMGTSPEILLGADIEELLDGFVNNFGNKNSKKKGKKADSPFKKKSIFFSLPYWSHNLCRHNLDVMHIEKNLCDKILGTLLNMSGKSKDHLNARLDLQEMGIRKDLHPFFSSDGKKREFKAAIFDMTNKEKETFCSVLENAKLPYGCAANIKRYVNTKERKITGYKSHDAHFILHYLLQFAVKRTTKPEVALPMIRLGAFLRGLWSKVIDLDELKRLQQEIIEVLCHFEMIFSLAFFDIMVHLPVHLCKEVEYGGPAHLRCMWPIERYLGKLKSYVRNKSKPEASIAEGYLAEECLIFCSRFSGGDGAGRTTKYSKYSAKSETCPQNMEYSIGTRRNKNGKAFHLKNSQWMACHRYILFNCGNKEIESLIEEHRALIDGHGISKKYKRERAHTDEFWKWLKEEVAKKEDVSKELEILSIGPSPVAKIFSGYVINGYRFHTKFRDAGCSTQNSGVFLTSLTTSFASSKDQNPMVGEVKYYGAIEEILEINYWGDFTVVLFRCCWYQEEKDLYGLTRVNFSRLYQKSDPYVMASQVQQVFYIEDPCDKTCHNVIKKLPRDWCEAESVDANEEDLNDPVLNDIHHGYGENQVCDVRWCRDDVPTTQVCIPPSEVEENAS